MNKSANLILSCCAALLFSLPSFAQPGPGGGGPGMTGGGPGGGARQLDCSKARNPEHCAAMQKAREICKDKAAGPERRQCMQDNAPKPDCSKARNPQRCEAMLKAHEACKDKAVGPERRQCMREQLAPAKPAGK